jgi:fatty acid desaturase
MRVFAHSRLDGVLVLLALVHLAVGVAGVVGFAVLPAWALVALFVVFVAMNPLNANCISHNFIHNAFFASETANGLFSALNSLAFGLPQAIYHWHHMNHHRWNNDRENDWSSIYRYGKDGQPESALVYGIVSFVRSDFGALIGSARKHRDGARVALEGALVIAFFLFLLATSWRGFVVFYLPGWYLGWSLSCLENYYEHLGGIPGDRAANAVSSYSRAYNLLSFNNGYHQEHHYRPQIHWTRMPEVTAEFGELFRRSGAPVIRGPHILAWLERPSTASAPAPATA